MPDANTTSYYRNREERERGLASAAVNPDIAAIHLELADRYQQLINTASLPRRQT